MRATESSYRMTYSGETNLHGEASMKETWDLPFEINVTGIDLENDYPCDGLDHELTIRFNGESVGKDLSFNGCSKVDRQPVSVTTKDFSLELTMKGFQRGRVTKVHGRAEIFHDGDAGPRRIPNTITVPYDASADASGTLSIEAAWRFPVEVTVTGIFLLSSATLDARVHKGRVELTADEHPNVEEFAFQGITDVGTVRLEVKGRRFHMKVVAEGFRKNTKVQGVVLVGFEP